MLSSICTASRKRLMHCDKLTELFTTHPALTRRARTIGEEGGISPDRTHTKQSEKMKWRGMFGNNC